MSAELRIRLDALPGAGDLTRRLSRLRSAKNYPATAREVQDLTREAQRLMLRAVQGKAVTYSGGRILIHRVTGHLHGSILGGYRYPLDGNPLRGGIVVKARYYKYLRDGFPPFDMKPGLLASAKAKISKSGVRYVVVPITEGRGRFAKRTCRILTSVSRGWIHPGLPPQPVGRYAQEQLRERAAKRLLKALQEDINR